MMVNRRPRKSLIGPAKKAPKKPPPVKTETTAPLSRISMCSRERTGHSTFIRFIGGRLEQIDEVGTCNSFSNDTQIVSVQDRTK